MGHRKRAFRLLVGSNRQGALIATAVGLYVGIVVFLILPIFGIEYWLWPASVIDWGVAVGCILLPTGVAFYRLGFLVTWWMTVPTHMAFFYHFYSQTNFALPPVQDGLLGYALASAQVAVAYGLIGYLLGTVGRWISDLGDETGIPTHR